MQAASGISSVRRIIVTTMNQELEIAYRDQHILVVNKPGDLLAVPGRGANKQDSVVQRARSCFPGMIEQPAVHRLDQQTSGLMVLALTADAHRHLSNQFHGRRVVKQYIGVVDGLIEDESGRITLPFRLDPENRPYQIYDPVNGKEMVTLWRNISRGQATTRIRFMPLTGRTHQLRVHSAHPRGLNAPIIGDRLYGSGAVSDAMMLHASYLSFSHPADNRIVEFHSEPHF